MVIEARYEDGVFRPLRKVKLKEGTVVEIRVNREDTQAGRSLSGSLVLLGCGLTAPTSKMA